MVATTTDLTDFGCRERELAKELLQAWNEQGLPEEFYEDGIQIMFNTNSGNVFLTNSDYQVAMMNNGKLEMYYTCPNCGNEGFAEETLTQDGKCENCEEQII